MKHLYILLFFITLVIQLSAQNKVIKTYENGATYIEGNTVEGIYSENNEYHNDVTDSPIQLGDKVSLKDGKWTFYYENGKVQAVTYFDKGKRAGVWMSYHANKQISSEENYDTGEAVYYLSNGKKFKEGKITKLGLKHGIWKFWNEEGSVIEKTYNNGLEVK